MKVLSTGPVYPDGLSDIGKRAWRTLAPAHEKDPLRLAVLEHALRLWDLADACAANGTASRLHRDTQVYAKLELGARRQFLACAKTLGLNLPGSKAK